MDYRKIDAALASALEDLKDPEERSIEVFIHTEGIPGAAEAEFLQRLGVSRDKSGRQMFTATLSAREAEELSEQPWLRYMRLSRKLRLLHR
jgi:hypothetical protein